MKYLSAAIVRIAFIAASCWCLHEGSWKGAVFFALAAWIPGVEFNFGGSNADAAHKAE